MAVSTGALADTAVDEAADQAHLTETDEGAEERRPSASQARGMLARYTETGFFAARAFPVRYAHTRRSIERRSSARTGAVQTRIGIDTRQSPARTGTEFRLQRPLLVAGVQRVIDAIAEGIGQSSSVCGDGECRGGESTATCSADCGSLCGDQTANGTETCDGVDVGATDCTSYGYSEAWTVVCNGTCDGFITTACTSICGDGVQEPGEACDDGIANGTGNGTCFNDCSGVQSCGDSVCNGTEISSTCPADCTEVCGDGMITGTEVCEPTDLGGRDCTTVGYVAAPGLICESCQNWYAGGCTSTCGNAVVEPDEDCEDGNATTETCPYGQETCTVCDSTCSNGPGIPNFCGDGNTDAGDGEDCDDGDLNGPAGACSATCQTNGGCSSITTVAGNNYSHFNAPPYLMWVTENAISVRWESTASNVGFVEFGTTSALGARIDEASAVTKHEFRLTGLTPNTTYHYRVGWDCTASDIYTFVTAPVDTFAGPIRFSVWGDNQDGDAEFNNVVDEMIATQPDFIMGAGDMVHWSSDSQYRNQLFKPLFGLANQTPFMAAAGNHEYYPNSSSLTESVSASLLMNTYYSQPGDERCFGYRYGEIFFLIMDTVLDFEPGDPQWTCLQNIHSSTDFTTSAYQIAIFHHPPRINHWNGGFITFSWPGIDREEVRDFLEPQLEGWGYDLVFNGHNHMFVYSPQTSGGITFFTSGGGGGGLETDSFFNEVNDWPQIQTEIFGKHHFLDVLYNNGAVTIDMIDTNGNIVTSYSL